MVAARRRGAGRPRVRAGRRAACAATLAGQLAVVGAGLLAGLVLWTGAARTSRPGAWRLLAAAPLLPVSGAAARPRHPVRSRRAGGASAGHRPCPATSVAIVAILAPGRPAPPARRPPARRRGGAVPRRLPGGGQPAGRRPGRALVGVRARRAAGPRVGRPRHVGHHGGGAHPAGRHRGRAAGRWPWSLLVGTVLLTLGRGAGHVRAAVGTPPVPVGRRPVPDRRRASSCSPSPSLLDARPGRRRPDAPGPPFGLDVGHAAAAHRPARPRSPTVGGVALDRRTAQRRHARRPGRSASSSPPCTAWLTAREEQRLGARLRRSEAYFRSRRPVRR